MTHINFAQKSLARMGHTVLSKHKDAKNLMILLLRTLRTSLNDYHRVCPPEKKINIRLFKYEVISRKIYYLNFLRLFMITLS